MTQVGHKLTEELDEQGWEDCSQHSAYCMTRLACTQIQTDTGKCGALTEGRCYELKQT